VHIRNCYRYTGKEFIFGKFCAGLPRLTPKGLRNDAWELINAGRRMGSIELRLSIRQPQDSSIFACPWRSMLAELALARRNGSKSLMRVDRSWSRGQRPRDFIVERVKRPRKTNGRTASAAPDPPPSLRRCANPESRLRRASSGARATPAIRDNRPPQESRPARLPARC
jgi:hypothetical protein